MSTAPARAAVLALLAECKEQPGEDRLRLILADWLEEHGEGADESRAELIRCQIEFERSPPEHPSRNEFARRARRLQQLHGREWLGQLVSWPTTWAVQRGLFSLVLPVASLRSKALAALAGTEQWAWVEQVQITNAEDNDVDRLAGCALLATVGSLAFSRGDLGAAGIQALGRLPWMQGIHRLDLSHQTVTDPGLRSLLNSPNVTSLRQFELGSSLLTAEAGGILGASPCAQRLERLVLWGNALGDLGVLGLRGQGTLTRLRHLDLRSNGLGDVAAEALAATDSFSQLRTLHLGDNNVGPRGAAALAASPHLGNLEALILWGNSVAPEGARLLAERYGGRVHVSPVGS